jgi:hypothetical protein
MPANQNRCHLAVLGLVAALVKGVDRRRITAASLVEACAFLGSSMFHAAAALLASGLTGRQRPQHSYRALGCIGERMGDEGIVPRLA